MADFYHMPGLRYHENGHWDLAIADFTKAIELDPEHLPAYAERAFVYMERGELDLSIADFTKAIELDPKQRRLLLRQGADVSQGRRT